MPQDKIKLCRDLLDKEKIGSHNYHNILLMAFSLFGLKPVSSIGVSAKNLPKFNGYINKLGFRQKKFPANPQGYHEIIVGKNIKNINKYICIDNMSLKNELVREKLLGEIFGYPKTAIKGMVKRLKLSKPIKFWVEVSENKKIPDELVIDNLLFDMIPASISDKESIKLGKDIINLLDKINPKISKYYLKLGRKMLKLTACEMLTYFKKTK